MKKIIIIILATVFFGCESTENKKKDAEIDLALHTFKNAMKMIERDKLFEENDSSNIRHFYSLYDSLDISSKKNEEAFNFAMGLFNKAAEGKKIEPYLSYEESRYFIDTMTMDEKVIYLNKCLENFKVVKDKFTQKEIYIHKTIGEYFPSRKTIYCRLDSDNEINLVLNYYANDWLFCKTAIILIDGKKYDLPYLDSYNSNVVHDAANQHIYENMTYTRKEDILKNISKNYQKEISVRCYGEHYYNDFDLSIKDKKAIKDFYDLYYLNNSINQLKKAPK